MGSISEHPGGVTTLGPMRQRWFSRRALTLHLAAFVFVASCLLAGWWQATRALGGNDLSYAYSVEWPLFAGLGVWAWWVLVHTDPSTAGARGLRARLGARVGGEGDAVAPVAESSRRQVGEEDPELAAYNDRLAALAADGRPKTWRRP